jgi:hypothetical protein
MPGLVRNYLNLHNVRTSKVFSISQKNEKGTRPGVDIHRGF